MRGGLKTGWRTGRKGEESGKNDFSFGSMVAQADTALASAPQSDTET